jgi:hypothetical protein
LKGATIGKRVDAAHPIAATYLKTKHAAKTPSPATGLDPLYEGAISYCVEEGRYTANILRTKFNIGSDRAKKIIQTMQAAGLIPGKDDPPITLEKSSRPHTRGHTVRNEEKKAAYPPEVPKDIPDNILEFVDMSLRQIIKKFGTDTAFIDWLKAAKEIENIDTLRIKNARIKGQLVHRDLIKKGVLDHVDAACRQLLTDGVKKITKEIITMGQAGEAIEFCEQTVRDHISSFIKPMKAKSERTLKNVGT